MPWVTKSTPPRRRRDPILDALARTFDLGTPDIEEKPFESVAAPWQLEEDIPDELAALARIILEDPVPPVVPDVVSTDVEAKGFGSATLPFQPLEGELDRPRTPTRYPEGVLSREDFENVPPGHAAPIEVAPGLEPLRSALTPGAALRGIPPSESEPFEPRRPPEPHGFLESAPPSLAKLLAGPVSKLGTTPESEQAIKGYLESVEPFDYPNPLEAALGALPEGFFTPEQERAIGESLIRAGLSPLSVPAALLDAGVRFTDFLTPEAVDRGLADAARAYARSVARLPDRLREGADPEQFEELGEEPSFTPFKRRVADFIEDPAASFAEQLYAATDTPRRKFEALFPGGVPKIGIGDQLVAEVFDPLTWTGGGLLKNVLANALSSAVRPLSYDDQSSPAERALFGAAATPLLGAALRGVFAPVRGALRGAAATTDYASRVVGEARIASDIRALESALEVAESRDAPAEVVEGIKRQIVSTATREKEPSRLTRGLGRGLSRAGEATPVQALAGAASIGATIGAGYQLAHRFSAAGDQQLDQDREEASPVRENANKLAASAALIGALIAGRRKPDDLFPDEIRSALRYFREGPERPFAAAVRYSDGTIKAVSAEGGDARTHFDALGRAYEDMTDEELASFEEGFLTTAGRFVSREDASALMRGRQTELESLHSGDKDYRHDNLELFARLRDEARLRGIDPDNPNHLLDTEDWRQTRREARVGHPYPDGNDEVARIALQYVRERPDAPGLTRVRGIDEGHAKRVADWYENAESAPHDPEVKRGYAQFVKELEEQAEMLRQKGYEMEPSTGDPYPSSAAMMRDLLENKRIKVYAGETEHPILTPEQNILLPIFNS